MIEINEAQSDAYLAAHSIFIFTEDSARRLMIVRMNRDMNQTQMAERLGCSQNVLSRIELGRIKFNEKITIYALQTALGKDWRFVVFNKNYLAFNELAITKRYWQGKFKKMGNGQ